MLAITYLPESSYITARGLLRLYFSQLSLITKYYENSLLKNVPKSLESYNGSLWTGHVEFNVSEIVLV